MSPAMARANIEANFEIDVRPILSSISVPTLVLHRKGDAVPIEHGRYYAEPHSRRAHGRTRRAGPLALHWRHRHDRRRDRSSSSLDRARPTSPKHLLATVLFTDIVGSTERAAALGDDAWRTVLEEHDEFVRGQLMAHGGREIKNLGDGVPRNIRPTCAWRCAARPESLRTPQVWGSASVPVCTQVSVSSEVMTWRGSPSTSERGSGRWPDADEVLVSGTVRDLVLGSGIQFSDRGQPRPKGRPRRMAHIRRRRHLHLHRCWSTTATSLSPIANRRPPTRIRS